MTTKRTFISFDYDHDRIIRDYFVGQAKNTNSPFEIVDESVRRHLSGDWEKKVQDRIGKVDLVVALCGQQTHNAEGVAAEVRMAQEGNKPYFLLRGRKGKPCTKPTTALDSDELQDWTWDNLRKQIEGKTLAESVEEWLNSPAPWLVAAGIGLALLIRSRNRRNRSVQPRQPVGTVYEQAWLGYPQTWYGRY